MKTPGDWRVDPAMAVTFHDLSISAQLFAGDAFARWSWAWDWYTTHLHRQNARRKTQAWLDTRRTSRQRRPTSQRRHQT